jgi:hypothetical protein
MSCPHLKEVVMLFCDAYPVKKMLPLDRLASAHPCLGREFDRCPLYQELAARLARECEGCPAAAELAATNTPAKEVCRVARLCAHPADADGSGPVRH